MRGETKELDDQARRNAGGSFVPLPDGMTHYELANPESQHTVILVHGFSVPYFIYDPTFEFLVQAGFRALRYDLFGRGYSDRPRADYTLEFFVKQLSDLLDALRIAPPVSLVGLSMGGPIAAAFIVRNPHRADNLILIGPVGARPIELSPLLKAAKIPILADAFLGLTGTGFLVESAANDFFDPELVSHFQARYKVQMQYKGFGRAILSTIRHDMLGSFIDIYRRLGTMKKQVLMFWGRGDKTVPFEQSADLIAAIPQAEFHIVEQCGHIPHYEKPGEVNPILLEFLKRPA
jgi:pimeloyl-ACP methyl ester carboxylesterase